MIWQIGNTTVRNPNRIREGLIAYYNKGEIIGLHESGNREAQRKLFDCLKSGGIIKSEEKSNDDKEWFARKWRLSFTEMGLISNKNRIYYSGQITKTGHALINADNEAEIQNIFLRILYNLEYRKKKKVKTIFRPLNHTLKILNEIQNLTGSSYISYHEFSLFVQDYKFDLSTRDYVKNIMSFRNEYIRHKGRIRPFLKSKYKEIADNNKLKPGTIRSDYPDVSIRLLKLSGLIINKGKGIRLNPQYNSLFDILIADVNVFQKKDDYYINISGLPSLPTDSQRELLINVIKKDFEYIKKYNQEYKEVNYSLTNKELEIERVKQNFEAFKINEKLFASSQKDKTQIICKWYECLIENIKIKNENDFGESIDYENDERPKYLEWITWRAFLLINKIKNPPYESRKFKIDSEFKPIHHAPSNTPDLVFEFEEFVLVIEVTFSTSSTQYSMEGEPVLRHVAKIAKIYNKPTFGLFLATKIDVNLAHLFLSKKVWFDNDQNQIPTPVVPLGINSFLHFFKKIPKSQSSNPDILFSIINDSLKSSHSNPNLWIEHVEKCFKTYF